MWQDTVVSDIIPLLVADVYELAAALRERGEEIARTVGRTQGEWQVLSVASDGPKTVPQIARRLGYARQSVQRTADSLVRDGFAEYTENPDHRTSPLLQLTEDGIEALAEITRAASHFHRMLARKLDPKDIYSAARVLRQMCALMDDVKPVYASDTLPDASNKARRPAR